MPQRLHSRPSWVTACWHPAGGASGAPESVIGMVLQTLCSCIRSWYGPASKTLVNLELVQILSSGLVIGSLFGSVLTESIGDISERIQKSIEPEIYFEFPTTADVFSKDPDSRRIPEFAPQQEYRIRKAPFLLSSDSVAVDTA